MARGILSNVYLSRLCLTSSHSEDTATRLTNSANSPDRAMRVFAKEQAAIFCDRHPDRSPPDISLGRHEASHEILVFASRFTVIERHSHNLVSGAPAAI